MIEDELRALLTDRAADVPDNPSRATQVRARVGGIRRRRAAGAALAVVLVVLAGVAVLRLPGHPDALPTAVPAGPYFAPSGRPTVPGFQTEMLREIDGRSGAFFPVPSERIPVRRLLAVRCQRAGTLVVRNGAGPSRSVTCATPVADRFEGAVLIEADEAVRLFAQTPAVENVSLEPSTPGQWDVVVLAAIAPDRLPAWGLPGRPLLDGADGPGGGTVTLTIPPRPRLDPEEAELYGFGLTADCVEGVELTLSVPTGPLATLSCDQQHGLTTGSLQLVVTLQDMDRLGLHPGDRVRLTVRSTGRQTDQWRLWRPDR